MNSGTELSTCIAHLACYFSKSCAVGCGGGGPIETGKMKAYKPNLMA